MNEAQSEHIEQLYEEMYDKLLIYAQCALGDPLAEEAVQETFRIACQTPDKLLHSDNPQGWLLLTLKNIVRSQKQKQKNAQRILCSYTEVHKPGDTVSRDPLPPEILYGNLADTEEFRLMSEMAIHGRSHQEMACARGISIPACKKRVQRAKELLRRKIKK